MIAFALWERSLPAIWKKTWRDEELEVKMLQ